MPRKHSLTRLSVIIFRFISFGVIIFGVFFAASQSLHAHPHVFIVQRINIVFDDQGLAGFRIHWRFDDMFSSMIAGDHDRNQNGHLESQEVNPSRRKPSPTSPTIIISPS